jgi:hypothetical protein
LFIEASRFDFLEFLKIFLDNSLDINVRNSSGESALTAAITEGNIPAVRLLLRNGALLDLHNSVDLKAVEIAIKNERFQLLYVLFAFQPLYLKISQKLKFPTIEETTTKKLVETPYAIVQRILELDGLQLNEETRGDFTMMVRDASRIVAPTYHARSTGKNRTTQIFVCALKQKFHDCHSKIVFSLVNNKVFICETNWIHTHSFDDTYIKSRNSISEASKSRIIDLTRLGVPPGIIRQHLNLSISSDALHGYRRNILQQQKEEHLKLEFSQQKWDKWDIKYYPDDQITEVFTFIHERISIQH